MKKLVSESISEFINEEPLNEGAKERLIKFVRNPKENEGLFHKAYITQAQKKGMGKLLDVLKGIPMDKKVEFARQTLQKMKDDQTLGIPWIIIRDRKIIGSSALKSQKATL